MRMLAVLLLGLSSLYAAGPQLANVDEAGYAKLVAANKGKVLLVDFWATWCVPCRKELPELTRMATRLQSKGVQLITVSADEVDKKQAASQFLAGAGVQGPAYIRVAKDDEKFINTVDPKWSGALPAL